MRLPRDLGGLELAKLLAAVGYRTTRQSGSHTRLTRAEDDRSHHITIPNHEPLKTGTLNSILLDIARELQMEKGTLARRLFGERYRGIYFTCSQRRTLSPKLWAPSEESTTRRR